MCGIAGLIGPQTPEDIGRMSGRIVHRGPDDSGVFSLPEAGVALASRRLAILDVPGGHQPMTTPDGRFTIVYNGEIYNAPELRAELEQRGVRLTTDHSDTEALLHLYALDGASALHKLNGMFAFAVYDRERRTVFCARDRLGIKPFYYFDRDGRFAFASELKSLLELPYVARDLDRQSLFHYMSLMYVPGERTIIKNVLRLPPGHSLTFGLTDRSLKLERWWRPSFAQENRSRSEWRELLRAELAAAVKRWTLADVPVGCSLSGGLDSSAIVGLLASAGAQVKTYSLGFTGPAEAEWNELPRAREVAQKWSTDHHELVLDPESLLEELPAMVWHLDEPYGGGLPSWTVFKFMSQDVKVGLTGTGGDELFGNYGKWRELEGAPILRPFRDVPSAERFRREFHERYYYFSDRDKHDRGIQDSEACEDTAAFLYRHFREGDSDTRNGVAYVDLGTQLPEEFLMMTDRFSMAHSLEARTPFLDHRLVECALSIPPGVRTQRGDLKGLLRETVADLLPPNLVHAGKKGFVIPLKLWLREKLRPLAESMLNPARLQAQGIFRPEFYGAFVRPHLEGRADHTQKVWAALTFQLWHHVYIDAPSPDSPTYDLKALTG